MIQDLISRLNKVRRTGKNRWIACCPAHNDKTPSLVITEKDDGMILMHCFGGNCSVQSIAESVGIDLAMLFPDNAEHVVRPKSRFHPMDMLEIVNFESMIVALCANDLANGKVLTQADHERLRLSCKRINAALEACK